MTEPTEESSGFDLASLASGGAPVAEMYRALVEELPAILYINGPADDSPTWFVSPQTTEILGLDPAGWYDNTWTRHVHPDDRDAMQENYVRALESGVFDADEYRFVRPDGETIWLHDSIRIIRDERGLPVLVQGVMFDVTERKRNEELLEKQAQTLARIAAIGQRFTELLLAGGDIQAILDTLAELVGSPVAFDDSSRELVGFAAGGAVADSEVLHAWESHLRQPHEEGHAKHCNWIAVWLREEEWGRLHLFADTDEVRDEVDALALDRAAAAIGLWLLSSRERIALGDRARSEFIADLWQGRRWSATDARARSRSLGSDIDQPVLLALAVEVVAGGSDEEQTESRARLLQIALKHLRRLCGDSGISCMDAVIGSVGVAIIGFDENAAVRPTVGRLATKLHNTVLEEHRDGALSIGVSRTSSAESLRRALTEAIDAAGHGAQSLRMAGTYHSSDLGLRHLLARLGEGPELGRFVDDELGALLAYDSTGKVPLIPTLRAFLESGGQKATAARMLHLERRSLYYRLERIEAMLDTDLDDPSARLRVQVALQSLDVLRQRNATFGHAAVK